MSNVSKKVSQKPSDTNNDKSVIDELRSYRVAKIALFDLLLSFIILAYISTLFGYSYWLGIIMTLPISIIAHLLFGIDTQLNYYLGLSKEPVRN